MCMWKGHPCHRLTIAPSDLFNRPGSEANGTNVLQDGTEAEYYLAKQPTLSPCLTRFYNERLSSANHAVTFIKLLPDFFLSGHWYTRKTATRETSGKMFGILEAEFLCQVWQSTMIS